MQQINCRAEPMLPCQSNCPDSLRGHAHLHSAATTLCERAPRTCNSRVVEAACGEDVGVLPASHDVVHWRVAFHVMVVVLLIWIAPLLPLQGGHQHQTAQAILLEQELACTAEYCSG